MGVVPLAFGSLELGFERTARGPRRRFRFRAPRLLRSGGRARGRARAPACRRLTRLASVTALDARFLSRHFARLLVVANAEEDWLTQPTVGGPLVELHFDDNLRAHPVCLLVRAHRCRERRGFPSEATQPPRHGRETLTSEAAARVADVHEVIAVEMAEEEGAEVFASVARFRVAPDDELLAELDLELEPVARSDARLVRRARALGDDALPVVSSRARQETLAVARAGITEPHADGWTSADEPFEALSPGGPWLADEHVVAIDEQIESDERGRRRRRVAADVRRVLQVHPVLKRLEPRRGVAVERHDLAVEDEGALASLRQRADTCRHLGELMRLVLAVPRDEPNAVAGREREDANAVILGLERPPLASRDVRPDRREHRSDALEGDGRREAGRGLGGG